MKRIIRGRVDISLFGGWSCLGGGVLGGFGWGAAGRSSNVRTPNRAHVQQPSLLNARGRLVF